MMQLQENILALIEKYFAGNEEEQQLFERIRFRLLNTIHEGQLKKVKRKNRKWLLPTAATVPI